MPLSWGGRVIPLTVLPYEGLLPWPTAHVLRGSEVIRTFWGITRAHAAGRALSWAQKQNRPTTR